MFSKLQSKKLFPTNVWTIGKSIELSDKYSISGMTETKSATDGWRKNQENFGNINCNEINRWKIKHGTMCATARTMRKKSMIYHKSPKFSPNVVNLSWYFANLKKKIDNFWGDFLRSPLLHPTTRYFGTIFNRV